VNDRVSARCACPRRDRVGHEVSFEPGAGQGKSRGRPGADAGRERGAQTVGERVVSARASRASCLREARLGTVIKKRTQPPGSSGRSAAHLLQMTASHQHSGPVAHARTTEFFAEQALDQGSEPVCLAASGMLGGLQALVKSRRAHRRRPARRALHDGPAARPACPASWPRSRSPQRLGRRVLAGGGYPRRGTYVSPSAAGAPKSTVLGCLAATCVRLLLTAPPHPCALELRTARRGHEDHGHCENDAWRITITTARGCWREPLQGSLLSTCSITGASYRDLADLQFANHRFSPAGGDCSRSRTSPGPSFAALTPQGLRSASRTSRGFGRQAVPASPGSTAGPFSPLREAKSALASARRLRERPEECTSSSPIGNAGSV